MMYFLPLLKPEPSQMSCISKYSTNSDINRHCVKETVQKEGWFCEREAEGKKKRVRN